MSGLTTAINTSNGTALRLFDEDKPFARIKTPQENAASLASEKGEFRRGALSAPAAQYPTGTVALGVSQEVIEAVAHLRTFTVDARFRKLTRLIDQLNKEFSITYPGALVNPLPLLVFVEKEKVESADDLSDEQKERCLWQTSMMDGVPTLAGYPVWERLPTEQQDYYFLFKLYRDQKYGYLTTGEPYVLSRSIASLAEELHLPPNVLYTFSQLFHWKQRCQSYDIHMAAERELREARYRQIIQRDHLHYARQLADSAYEKLKASNNLKPRDLLAMLELGLKYSRISIGLPADKPEGLDGKGSNQTTIVSVGDVSANQQTLNIQANSANTPQVVKDFGQQIKSDDTIRSILHVLQRSGAVDVAVNELLGSQNLPVADTVPDDHFGIHDDGILEPASASAESSTFDGVMP